MFYKQLAYKPLDNFLKNFIIIKKKLNGNKNTTESIQWVNFH